MSAADPPAGDWYRDAFRQRYLDLYRHRSAAAARTEIAGLAQRLAFSPPSRVLDLCCGAGRHSDALRALGYSVVGMDLSLDLLRAQREVCSTAGVVRGDMRFLPFGDATFELVLQLFTSFGYFPEASEDEGVLREAARVTSPRGSYVLDLMNRERVLSTLVPHSVERRDGRRFEQWRTFDPASGRIVKRVEMEREDGSIEHWSESVRVFTADDIVARMERSGWSVDGLLGTFRGESYARDSERMIVVGRRI